MIKMYLPKTVGKSIRFNLFSLFYPTLPIKQINHHIQRLISHLKKPPVCQVLANKNFWVKLKNSAPNEAQKWHDYWHQIETLAHLNSRDLIGLLHDEIGPLEKYLRFMEESLSKANPHDWQPEWVSNRQKKLLKESQINLERLKKVKLKIEQALLVRTEVHSVFNTSYHCDDALGQLCKQIDAIQPDIENYLNFESNSIISDDDRVTIYDILRRTGRDNSRISNIIAPIQKKPVKTFIQKSVAAKLLRETAEFIHQIVEDLQQSTFRKLFSYTVKEAEKSVVEKAITHGLEKIGLLKFAGLIYRYRYGVYFFGSIIIYGALLQFLMPILLLSSTAISVVPSLLFYTVGIAPLWYFVYTQGQNILNGGRELLFYKHKQDLFDALKALENASFFVANQLSQAIIDIPHFNIHHLVQQAQHVQKQLALYENKLSKSFGRTWLMPRTLREAIDSSKEKLKEQNKLIEDRCKLLAMNIADQIGEEMILLCESADSPQLTPCLTIEQITRLDHMVNQYAGKEVLSKFRRDTDVTHVWSQKMDVHNLGVSLNQASITSQPWGGFDIRKDALNGWKIILGLVTDPEKRAICLRINALLAGKSDYTLTDLRVDLKKIYPEFHQVVLKNIQWFVFNTLSQRPAEHASLLNLEQKKLINTWFSQHYKEIQEANDAIAAVFSQSNTKNSHLSDKIPDSTLIRYYELLDSGDIYYYVNDKLEALTQRGNQARQFFESYQGENSFAYRLLKFVPKKEKTKILATIALKRLQWILLNLDNRFKDDWFDETDGEMFHNYRLLNSDCTFHFGSVIQASPQYNQPYQINMEKFLLSCQNHGFDSDNLLEKYVDRHYRTKPMLMMDSFKKNSAIKFTTKQTNSIHKSTGFKV